VSCIPGDGEISREQDRAGSESALQKTTEVQILSLVPSKRATVNLQNKVQWQLEKIRDSRLPFHMVILCLADKAT